MLTVNRTISGRSRSAASQQTRLHLAHRGIQGVDDVEDPNPAIRRRQADGFHGGRLWHQAIQFELGCRNAALPATADHGQLLPKLEGLAYTRNQINTSPPSD